jgi:Domain of unknown function (DUF4352)
VIVVLVVVGCCSAGCRKTDPGATPQSKDDTNKPGSPEARLVPASPETVAVGQVARNSYFEMTTLGTQLCSVEAHFRPPAGVEKLGVEVRITGVNPTEVPINPFYAELRDGSGQRFESTLAGCSPALPARQVRQGESATGWITFDVPVGLRDLELRYEPIVIGVGRVASHHRLDR